MTLRELLMREILTDLIPSSLGDFIKYFEHFHLATFFIWRRFYEFAKRLTSIDY